MRVAHAAVGSDMTDEQMIERGIDDYLLRALAHSLHWRGHDYEAIVSEMVRQDERLWENCVGPFLDQLERRLRLQVDR